MNKTTKLMAVITEDCKTFNYKFVTADESCFDETHSSPMFGTTKDGGTVMFSPLRKLSHEEVLEGFEYFDLPTKTIEILNGLPAYRCVAIDLSATENEEYQESWKVKLIESEECPFENDDDYDEYTNIWSVLHMLQESGILSEGNKNSE